MEVRTGEECPAGTAVFQTTFFCGPNSEGKPVDDETPVPFGPRNRDQSSGPADRTIGAVTNTQVNAMNVSVRAMGMGPMVAEDAATAGNPAVRAPALTPPTGDRPIRRFADLFGHCRGCVRYVVCERERQRRSLPRIL